MLTLRTRKLAGKLRLPAAKSLRERVAVCGALSGSAVIEDWSADGCEELLSALVSLGASFTDYGGRLQFFTQIGSAGLPRVDCGENRALLHLLAPVLLVSGGGVLEGVPSVFTPPLDRLCAVLEKKGALCEPGPGALYLAGTLSGGLYTPPAELSVPMLSGLLLALAGIPGDDSIIQPATGARGHSALLTTARLLRQIGHPVDSDGARGLYIRSIGGYQPFRIRLEPDMVLASFVLAADFLGSRIEILNLDKNSCQRGAGMLHILPHLLAPGDIEIDLTGQGELAPPLAAASTAREGITVLTGLSRRRRNGQTLPERLSEALCGVGVSAEPTEGALILRGGRHVTGGIADARHDPLCALMLAVLSTVSTGEISILDAGCAEEYVPGFWRTFKALGGDFSGS